MPFGAFHTHLFYDNKAMEIKALKVLTGFYQALGQPFSTGLTIQKYPGYIFKKEQNYPISGLIYFPAKRKYSKEATGKPLSIYTQ